MNGTFVCAICVSQLKRDSLLSFSVLFLPLQPQPASSLAHFDINNETQHQNPHLVASTQTETFSLNVCWAEKSDFFPPLCRGYSQTTKGGRRQQQHYTGTVLVSGKKGSEKSMFSPLSAACIGTEKSFPFAFPFSVVWDFPVPIHMCCVWREE